ncbi:MAG: FecR domain-containing protein [Bryobacteraceae bacterium]|nr:FecR domain-containing protein [Bryobacteraceae bacterium]
MKREGDMQDDRLEKALEAMRAETAPAAEEEAARARVWERLMASPEARCAGFRAMLEAYAEGRLEKSRQWLLEDHLGRCAPCRRAFAELRGAPRAAAIPAARATLWQRTRVWAVAAGVAALLTYAGRDRMDRWLAPAGPRAVIEQARGPVYDAQGHPLKAGAAIPDQALVRTAAGGRALLRLADGSRVEVNERTEFALIGAWSGTTVRMTRGDIFVEAARQRRGALRVQTRDAEARVRGTVFAVSSGLNGSMVTVLEGSVEVRNAGGGRLLKPGEIAATNPALESADVRRAVAWSAEAEKYLGVLAEFSAMEKELTRLTSAPPRTAATVLAALPRDPVVYIAAPNLGAAMERALSLMSERAAQNTAFAEWWNSPDMALLRDSLSDLARISPMLGEETVFTVSLMPSGAAPVLLAPVKPGLEQALEAELRQIRASRGHPLAWRIADGRLTVAPTQDRLDWALRTAGEGAATPFAQEIAAHYQRGAGWMAAIQPGTRLRQTTGQEFPVRFVFFEQRRTVTGDEQEMMLRFTPGASTLPAWLDSTGNSTAAEYFSKQANVVFAGSSREPRQIYDEMVAQMGKLRPEAAQRLAEIERKLGVRLGDDIASSLGTDFAVGIEQPAVPVPVWLAVMEVRRPATLDGSITRLVDALNQEFAAQGAGQRLTLKQESSGGRSWKTLTAEGSAASVTWTYHGGFLVAGPDRAAVERAIATREGGLTLVQQPAFRSLLPAATGVHPAGFLWVNLGDELRKLAAGLSNPALKTMLENRGPALVTLASDGERIRAASRSSFASLLLDAMLAGRAQSVSGPAAKQARKERNATARR